MSVLSHFAAPPRWQLLARGWSWSRAREATVLFGLALAAFALALEAARYLALGAFLDHIESSVVIDAWQFAHGQPLYDIQRGLPRFATYYGPLAYLVELPPLLVSATVAASKLAPLFALAASIALMAAHFLRRSGLTAALHPMFFLLGGLLLFSPMSFWARPDPFELLAVAAAVADGGSPLVVGVCLGLAVNLKAHAFFYFTPILLDIALGRGWRRAALAAAVGIGVFLVPFLAPGISLRDYIAVLAQQVGGRAPNLSQLGWVALCFIALALPVLLPMLARGRPRRDRLYAAAALAALAALLYPATFPGAGPYHFLPLLPVLAEARRRLRPEGIGAQLAPFLPMLLAAPVVQYNLAEIKERAGWAALADEAVALAQSRPGAPAQIGYGDSRRGYELAQLARTKLSLAGVPAKIDAQVLMELQQIGADGSERWLRYLAECRVGGWVLPKDEAPFALRNFYYDGPAVFDAAFREAFLGRYRSVGGSAHFTLWECRGAE